MRTGRVVLIVLLAVILSAVMLGVGVVMGNVTAANDAQKQLEPFYTPPAVLPATPGVTIRTESLGAEVKDGKGYRMLYSSALSDGSISVSGAMVFVPDGPAPAGGRKVVAFAHGTVGQGDACAPSRDPEKGMKDLQVWLPMAMREGWIVVATDYTGLGTPGPNYFLVGGQESRDVVYSVRAVVDNADYQAGKDWIVVGHSQGGHAALWTGHLAAGIDPGLHLLGVAAAAPAAELDSITNVQWDTMVGWVIGPEVAVSWPVAYPGLPLQGVISDSGLNQYQRLANECVMTAAIEGLVRAKVGQRFFTASPGGNPEWAAVLKAETPGPLPADMPMMLVQGTGDTVVLPWPNADLQTTWCKAGTHIESQWLGNVNHMAALVAGGPNAVAWMAQLFNGQTPASSCDAPLPVLERDQTGEKL